MVSSGTRPPHVPYTPWHLLEHLRLTQRDILDFIRDPDYTEPSWPDDYWPSPDAQTDESCWRQTIESSRADLTTLQDMVADARTQLTIPVPTEWDGSDIPARGAAGSRPQLIPHRGVRDPAAGDGDVAEKPLATIRGY